MSVLLRALGVVLGLTAWGLPAVAHVQLRVEAGGIPGLHRTVVAHPDGQRLFSVGDDRSVRVWRRSDLRLLDTWLVPFDPELAFEGRAYYGDVSNDGTTLAVGGWTTCPEATRVEWPPKFCIYLYDTATGRIREDGTIRGLPDAVTHLSFAAGGRLLIAGLGGAGGLHIIDASTRRVVASDCSFTQPILGIDASRTDRIYVTSQDGTLRIYELKGLLVAADVGRHRSAAATPCSDTTSAKPNAKWQLLEGRKPTRGWVSPDGRQVLVSFLDSKSPAIYDAATGALKARVSVPDSARFALVSGATWSADGRWIFIAASGKADAPATLFRIPVTEQVPVAQHELGRYRVFDLLSTATGEQFFTLEEGRLGLVGVDGTVRYSSDNGIPDYRRLGRRLEASADGSMVRLPVDQRRDVLFDLARTEARFVERGAAVDSFVPAVQQPLPAWFDWSDARHGEPLAGRLEGDASFGELENSNDRLWSAAALPDGRVVLGTEFGRLLIVEPAAGAPSSPSPRPRYRVVEGHTVPGAGIERIVVAPERQMLIAASIDGVIRWIPFGASGRGSKSNAELLNLFVHSSPSMTSAGQEQPRWVAWLPGGQYASSPGGDEMIAWAMFRGPDRAPDMYRAVQLERRFFDVRRVQRALLDTPTGTRVSSADLASIAPPRIDAPWKPTVRAASDPGAVELIVPITVKADAAPIRTLTVFVDDLPVTPFRERAVQAQDAQELRRELRVTLTTRAKTLRIEAASDLSLSAREVAIPDELMVGGAPTTRGDLYFVGIAAGEFDNLPESFGKKLLMTQRDVSELASVFKKAEGKAYRKVHMRLLYDDQRSFPATPVPGIVAERPTRRNIEAALELLREARAEDTVLVAVASHGYGYRGTFYLMPTDVAKDDVCRIMREADQKGFAAIASSCVGVESGSVLHSLIDAGSLYDAVAAAAGSRYLFLDTCEAGRLSDGADILVLRKRSASSRFGLLLASAAGQPSVQINVEPYRHGLFTYSILQQLRRNASSGPEGADSVEGVFDAARSELDRSLDSLRRRFPRQTFPVQTPSFEAPARLRAIPLIHG